MVNFRKAFYIALTEEIVACKKEFVTALPTNIPGTF